MADKQFDVKVVISAVDNATAQFKEINKKLANSPLAKLSGSLQRIGKASGITDLGKGFANVGRAAGEVTAEAGALFTKLAALGGLAGAGLFGLAKNFSDFGDQVNDTAVRLGISTDKVQEYQNAAKLAGVDQDTFNTSLDRFSKNIGEAGAGSGEALVAFQGMGVALKGPDGKLRKMSDILPEVVGKLNKIGSAQARAAFGAKLFGKQFGQLVPLITEFEEKTAKARQFIIPAEDIERADKFTDKFNELKLVMGKVAMVAGSALLPGFEEAFGTLQSLLMENKDAIGQFFKAIGAALPGIVQSMASVAKAFSAFFTIVNPETGKLEVNMGRLKLVFGAVALVMAGPLLLAVGNLGVALLGLGGQMGGVLLKLGLWMSSGMRFIPLLASMSGVFTTLGTVFGWVGTMAGAMWAFITGPVGLVIAAVGLVIGAGVLLYKKWEPFRNLIDYIWEKIKAIGSAIASSSVLQTITNAVLPGAGSAIGMAMGPEAGGASALQSSVNTASTQKQEASVNVNFENMPKGTNVQVENKQGLDLGLSRGFAMGGM